jgi:hypothetical protein
VGVAGLVVGAVFGVMAANDKSAAQCDATNACKHGPLSDARNAATLSTVGFVAGGALLAGGIALVLLAPTSRPQAERALRLQPAVAVQGAGLLLTGSF